MARRQAKRAEGRSPSADAVTTLEETLADPNVHEDEEIGEGQSPESEVEGEVMSIDPSEVGELPADALLIESDIPPVLDPEESAEALEVSPMEAMHRARLLEESNPDPPKVGHVRARVLCGRVTFSSEHYAEKGKVLDMTHEDFALLKARGDVEEA